MLSMKTLKVAIVTMGSALLLGPGLAVAQHNINLNGTQDGGDPPMPRVFASETLGAADAKGRRGLEFNELVNVFVEPRRAIGVTEQVFLRIDLAGAAFGAQPQLLVGDVDNSPTISTGTEALSSGGAGTSHAVLIVGAVGADDVVGVQIQRAGGDSADDLLVTSASGNVTATITAYSDPDDALDEVGARGTFSGTGAIVSLVSGLTVTIKAADTATASVNHGFLWFLGPTGQAPLGWVGLEENEDVMAGVRNAATGEPLARGDILLVDDQMDDAAIGMVSFNIMGNLDTGAFTVKPETFRMRLVTPEGAADGPMEIYPDDAGKPVPTGTCAGVAEGGVDRGTLKDADGELLIGEEGERSSGVEMATTGDMPPGIYLVCVNVDVMGPETNMYAITESDYSATAHFKTGRNALEAAEMAGMEGDLAAIERNGASVDIPYLTTSEKHNQRVIIVNRGTRPIAITAITFTSEDGTDVELMPTMQAAMDAGLLAVAGNSTWVARMDETVNITGDSKRTAATFAFAATPGALSVATTQVNISDGSTDTVVYKVDE